MATLNDRGVAANSGANPIFGFSGIKGETVTALQIMKNDFKLCSWNVNDLVNPGGNPDMSNIRLFGTSGLAVVPLPAGVWLLAAAFGGLGTAARYK